MQTKLVSIHVAILLAYVLLVNKIGCLGVLRVNFLQEFLLLGFNIFLILFIDQLFNLICGV